MADWKTQASRANVALRGHLRVVPPGVSAEAQRAKTVSGPAAEAAALLQVADAIAGLREVMDFNPAVADLKSRLAALEAERSRIRAASPAERDRWTSYLVSLGWMVRDGTLTEYQARGVNDLWHRAMEIEPNVMYPTATVEDGAIQLSWCPRGRTLTVEVHREAVDWFFEDDATSDSDGSEEPIVALPPRFFTYLRTFRRA